MRRLTSIAAALLLAGAGSSLVGVSATIAALGVRQAVRAAPIHPFGAAAGLVAVPAGAACWWLAQRILDQNDQTSFRYWLAIET